MNTFKQKYFFDNIDQMSNSFTFFMIINYFIFYYPLPPVLENYIYTVAAILQLAFPARLK
jgi:hypothetical protein